MKKETVMKQLIMLSLIFNTSIFAEMKPIMQVFDEVGDEFGAHFIIESYIDSADAIIDITGLYVDADNYKYKNIEQFLLASNKKFKYYVNPNFEEVKDALIFELYDEAKKIIRVSSKSFSNLNGYLMNDKVTIDYKGTPYGLIRDINRILGVNILIQSQPRVSMFVNVDNTSEVRVKSDKATVREVLTKSINLDEYNYVIWSSAYFFETKELGVIYYGKRNKEKQVKP